MRSFGSAVFSLLLLLLFLFISQSSALSRFRRRSGKSSNPAPYKQQTYNQQPHYQQQEEATNAGGYNRNYGETQNWQQQKQNYGEQLPATWQWQRSYGSQPAEHKTDRQRSDQLLTTVTSASIIRGATQRVINYTRLTSVFGFVFNQYKRLVYAKLVVFYGAEAAAEIANAFVNAWKSISFGEFNSWLEARRENGLQDKMLDLGREFASKLKEPLQLMAKGLFNAKVWEEKTRNLFTMNAIIHFALDFLLPFGLSFFVTDDISKPIALRFITFWHNDLKGKEKELQDQMDEYINRSVPGPLTKSMTTLTYNGILSTIYQGIKGVQLYNNFINGDVKAIVKQFEPALLFIKQQAVQVHNLEAMVKHVIKWLLVKKAPLLDILFYEIIDEHIERISEPIAVGLGVVLFEVEKAAVANLENSDAGKGQTKKHTD